MVKASGRKQVLEHRPVVSWAALRALCVMMSCPPKRPAPGSRHPTPITSLSGSTVDNGVVVPSGAIWSPLA